MLFAMNQSTASCSCGTLLMIISLCTMTILSVRGFATPPATTTNGLSNNGILSLLSQHHHRHHRQSSSSLHGSRNEAETYLSQSYPKFYSFLQLNPSALQRMREAKSGYAVFAVSDDNINTYYTEQFGLLESACVDEELQQIVQRMASYHLVNMALTAENMSTFQVATTAVGELPVETDPNDGGSLYINGIKILHSYQFEDALELNHQDGEGNVLGSQVGMGNTCIIHEVDGFVCPNDMWEVLYSHYNNQQSA